MDIGVKMEIIVAAEAVILHGYTMNHSLSGTAEVTGLDISDTIR